MSAAGSSAQAPEVLAPERKCIAQEFHRAENGNVGMLFAAILVVMCMMIGGAVDLGRWLNARDRTIAAIDAALLTAGRALQTGASEAEAMASALKIYKSNTQNRLQVLSDDIRFVVTESGGRITSEGNVTIATPFLRFANVEKLELFNQKDAPEVTTAQERNQRFHREISLMLDVSGSMCPGGDCWKLNAMKVAANDLIDIVTKNNPTSEYKARVALVPFSGEVLPPASVFNQVTQPALPASINDMDEGNVSKSACVGERGGSNRYNDVLPGAGDYIPVIYGSCSLSTQRVVPLTADAAVLKANVLALKKASGTAGEIGTAWARYMLSPAWAPVLGVSAPVAFGTAETKKIAILMTDGQYNEVNRYLKTQTVVGTRTETYACKVRGRWTTCTRTVYDYDTTTHTGTAISSSSNSASINGVNASVQAVAHCEAMKADGIEVFTVGFDLAGNETAVETLESCASSKSHAYLAESAESLKQAFRDIAIKASNLYVSK